MTWKAGIVGVTPWHLLLAGLTVFCYCCAVAIYRLYFSPLAKFPGPKLAALTSLYAGYYDVIRGGQYVWIVEEMHRKYGPVVRVRPDVLHVNDPSSIEKLYPLSPKHRRERYKTILKTLQLPGSILATQDHDLHRKRRSVLNPFFSQQNVRRLEPIINDTLATLLRRMDRWAQRGDTVHLSAPFRAATKDIIQSYALGDSAKFLEMEDCNAPFFDVMGPSRVTHFGTEIPESEKTAQRLADEAVVLLIAGSETTASTLAAITFHLLDEPPSHRQDRVAPDEDLVLETTEGKKFVIPAGTPFGMTAPIINRHPALYENPNVFYPDRYIENPKLLKSQFSFSKGARQCIGMNLAYQELQSLTAGIFRKYDVYDPTLETQTGPTLELYETKIEDIAMDADYITTSPYPGSQGVRVRIRG
ncbi:hypothetical protein JX265_000052 [Neoarthrinium moseri]|uniref:Cytochrome P450 n=1 Tax=Neoarthrinium moseri TaxID=1658444 RepID=A0A9P9WY28_9PEZI|nr:hypothetical protein JX265_000052 [Neoarthrinium moseri]